MSSHENIDVTQYPTSALFAKAFIPAATMTTAINIYRATDIWPMNKGQIFCC